MRKKFMNKDALYWLREWDDGEDFEINPPKWVLWFFEILPLATFAAVAASIMYIMKTMQ